jgi:hypothetical protein
MNFSIHPSNIANAGASRSRTSLEASRSFDQGYNPQGACVVMGSFEHAVRLMSIKISLVNHPRNHGPPKVPEIPNNHIELPERSKQSGHPNQNHTPNNPASNARKH